MSRQIDLTKPLSDEDRQYLEDRGRHQDIARADGEYSDNTPADSIEALQEQSPNTESAHAGAQNPDPVPAPDPALVGGSAADLASPATEHTVAATEEPPHAPPAEPTGDDSVPDPDSDDESDNYDDEDAWEFRDLQEEAKDRGLSAGGSRADIIARLREHDAAN